MSLFKKILLIVANALCVALLIAATIIAVTFSDLLRAQQAAAAWKGESEERFSQISVYLPDTESISENTVRSFEKTVDTKLVDASIDTPENGSLWTYAYSSRGELTVEGSRGSASTDALGVGGDFFLFHPYYLLSGSYIYETDLMKDRVVLDEELAWKLFGGTDLAGMEVTISGRPYVIAGVVRRETDFASKKGGCEGTMIFVSYGVLNSDSAGGDEGGDSGGISTEKSTVGITCYEAVLPNQISGFAKQLIEDNFSVGGGEVIENTGRFGIERMFSVIGDFGERSMRVNGVIYPYWENAARCIEDWLALVLTLSMVISICPLITIIWLLIQLKKYLKNRSKDVKDALERQADKITRVRYEKRLKKEEEKELERVKIQPMKDDFDIESIVQEVLDETKKESSKK